MLKRIFALTHFALITALSFSANSAFSEIDLKSQASEKSSHLTLESDFTEKSKLANFDFSSIVFPSDLETHKTIGNCTQSALPPTFEILVWNVEKGKQGYLWSNDFDYLLLTNDIALVQEGMLDPMMTEVFSTQKNHCWDFAISFIESQKPTGVVTGSVYTPSHASYYRSPFTEPLLHTPKMAVITKYPMQNSTDELMVVNLHALNFVEDSYQEAQLVGLEQIMQKHTGPLIFAGDFNSWTTRRQVVITRIVKKLGLNKAKFPRDSRTFKIDHIFYRGLNLKQSRVHMGISSSDHRPLTAVFSTH